MSLPSITPPCPGTQKRQPWPDDHSTTNLLPRPPRATYPTSGNENGNKIGNVFGKIGNAARLLTLARLIASAPQTPEKSALTQRIPHRQDIRQEKRQRNRQRNRQIGHNSGNISGNISGKKSARAPATHVRPHLLTPPDVLDTI